MDVRVVDPACDFPREAELLTAVESEPTTVEQLAEWERKPVPGGLIRERLVRLDAGGVVQGYSDAAHWPWDENGQFWLQLAVDPGQRGRGVGAQLYTSMLAFAQRHGARTLEAKVRDDDSVSLVFAQRRGFHVRRHILELRLDLASFDDRPYRQCIEEIAASGIRFFSLADLGDTEEARRKLHAINSAWVRDVPGRTGKYVPFEQFVAGVCDSSWYRADGQIVAADGDRWVGMSAVGYFANTNSTYNLFTGVDPEYRGRHIALALKVLALGYARRLGADYISTNNDSANTPMLAVNQRLGYTRATGEFIVTRVLSGGAEQG